MNAGMPDILIAIGGNLPGPHGESPQATCEWAAERLGALPGLHLAALSRWYETLPEPPSDQPNYVNGAVRLEGDADPAALLAGLHAIEAEAGRVRTVRHAARPLDLDLIAIGGIVRAAPPPILPHPRAHLRRFVLCPLCDVAPDWRHPLTGATPSEMLAALS